MSCLLKEVHTNIEPYIGTRGHIIDHLWVFTDNLIVFHWSHVKTTKSWWNMVQYALLCCQVCPKVNQKYPKTSQMTLFKYQTSTNATKIPKIHILPSLLWVIHNFSLKITSGYHKSSASKELKGPSLTKASTVYKQPSSTGKPFSRVAFMLLS